MSYRQSTKVISVLLIALTMPWLVFGQAGSVGGLGTSVGGMGGMGGGVYVPEQIFTYHRPDGSPPNWLTNGLASVRSTEALREMLNETVNIELEQKDLLESFKYLREQYHIDFDFDLKHFGEESIVLVNCSGLPVGHTRQTAARRQW